VVKARKKGTELLAGGAVATTGRTIKVTITILGHRIIFEHGPAVLIARAGRLGNLARQWSAPYSGTILRKKLANMFLFVDNPAWEV
jgi:hypothetical protein